MQRYAPILQSNSINVLDISQTIVQDFFNMMMIVDMSSSAKPFAELRKRARAAWRRNWRKDQMPAEKKFLIRCTASKKTLEKEITTNDKYV